jgi:hypothetical protein
MQDASPAALTPTKATYQAFQTAYDHFNRQLFQNRLPPCLITLGRRDRRTYGHFAPARFREIDGQRRTDEIAMNPQHFLERPMAEILSTLAHEMARNADSLIMPRRMWTPLEHKAFRRGWSA